MAELPVIGVSVGYLAALFGVAYWAERRSGARRSLVGNPYIYALSLAVYCTAWTYYGSVGRASQVGIEFLAIYLGPTLLAPIWWLLLRKIIRICRQQRLTSIADFLSARYGKSASLGAVVTVLCVVGSIPYIALQIKAIAASFALLTQGSGPSVLGGVGGVALATTIVLAFFTIIFGVRSVEATERHDGMVFAVAVESLVKLVAFLAVGVFVVWGLFSGPTDIFDQAAAVPALKRLFTLQDSGVTAPHWRTLLLLSGAAIILLPRQFQLAVVENTNEDHLRKAMWLFPLYLLIINLFVLPIALGGALRLGATDADFYVLALPLHANSPGLALLTYIGGLSAASSMIIVETVALAVMLSNHLLMPLLVRIPAAHITRRPGWFAYLSQSALWGRRLAVAVVLLLAYGWYMTVGQGLALVNIGLVSFAAVAQLVPVVLGSLYWKGGTRSGAMAGLLGGFLLWFVTLVLPTFVGPGWLAPQVLADGLFGLPQLRPEALFGLTTLDPLTHGLFWSWTVNILLFVGVSLFGEPSGDEAQQAVAFVDVFKGGAGATGAAWAGAPLPDVRALLTGFLGPKRTAQALRQFSDRHPDALTSQLLPANATPADTDPRLLTWAEKLLAGSIGPAAARLLLASATGAQRVTFEGVVGALRESQQLVEANRQLRRQQRELQRLTTELQTAYHQLQGLDQLKDEFLSTVTHELRTPLTSIRALAEILYDVPDLQDPERSRFLLTITRESDRLSRLITLVLDLEKFESGKATLDVSSVDMADVVADAVAATEQLATERQIQFQLDTPATLPFVPADRDRLMQVLVNLLSNAIKASPTDGTGRISVRATAEAGQMQLTVTDNGKGIDPAYHTLIFDKFFQARNQSVRKPEGSGLGLAITKKIVELHLGTISVESAATCGAVFRVTLPLVSDKLYSRP